jgi:hypothetical protein
MKSLPRGRHGSHYIKNSSENMKDSNSPGGIAQTLSSSASADLIELSPNPPD